MDTKGASTRADRTLTAGAVAAPPLEERASDAVAVEYLQRGPDSCRLSLVRRVA